MKYYYSLKTQGFYPAEMLNEYKEAGSLPDDLKEISEEDYLSFFNPPEGYGGFFDEKGPRIEKLPAPDYVAIASQQKEELIAEANTATYPFSLKMQMGRTLTAAETAKVNAWLDYIDVLNDTDISDAPDVQWPKKPE